MSGSPPSPASVASDSPKRLGRRLASAVGPPAVLLAIFVVVWQLAVTLLGIKPFLLPGPAAVAESALNERAKLLAAMTTTGLSAVGGLLLAIVIGVAVSFAFAQSRIVRQSFFPYAILLQTTPIVAIAPLLINWFGSGQRTVVIVSFIICLFPIVVNVTAGLTSAPTELVELFRLYRATRRQRFLKLQLPHSVSYLVAGARTSSGLSVVGAIVGEFYASFGGESTSLGHLIVKWQNSQNNGALIAAVFASTLLGVLIFSIVSLIGDTLLRRYTTAA
jgi:NitT/TauT family transport system permease protein